MKDTVRKVGVGLDGWLQLTNRNNDNKIPDKRVRWDFFIGDFSFLYVF